MLDDKVFTFLTLCDEMNYRRAAQRLSMTQPAVTQHIHALEAHYGVKLFHYDGRALHKTEAADALERRMRILCAEEDDLRRQLEQSAPEVLRVGATKTIGEYVLAPMVSRFVASGSELMELTVGNTADLLREIDAGRLDFALIEGSFDKARYAFRPFRREAFVGVCSREHPFAGRTLPLEQAFEETLILREPGSGSRVILEQALLQRGYGTHSFRRSLSLNHPALIAHLAREGLGITFAYRSMVEGAAGLASFQVEGMSLSHDFCYVYLNPRIGESKVRRFEADAVQRLS